MKNKLNIKIKSNFQIQLLSLLLSLFTIASGQSLFNRWVGTDSFTGSARSMAIGATHLLNSQGSQNIRYNPGKLANSHGKSCHIQLDRSSIFERWSMPVRDSFDEFLTNADYVANEFSIYNLSAGALSTMTLPGLGNIGLGLQISPLTNFNYTYSEEVRGSYRIADGEYASKDPVVGYQRLHIEGKLNLISIGAGLNLKSLLKMNGNIGASVNLIQSGTITDLVEVDTLYSDVTNLSTYPDVSQSIDLPRVSFISISAQVPINENYTISGAWEGEAISKSSTNYWITDSTNGLFQFWDDSSNYAINGANYMKPEQTSIGFNYLSGTNQNVAINFQIDNIQYDGHLNLNDLRKVKFGFEYFTQMGTPVRGGLVYSTSPIPGIKPTSTLTFGSGKSIGNIQIDAGGSYGIQSFNYPDLFPVVGDIRPDYDLVRDSRLNLKFALNYIF